MTTSGFVDVEGSRLNYEVTGSGPPVVLLHGGWLDMRQWDDQVEALAREHQVIRYDARGYGRSPLGSVPYSHSADLAALLRELAAERPHLVALSNGASIAVEFTIWSPTPVRSLVVGCAPMRGHDLGPEFTQGMRAVIAAGAAGLKDDCRAALWGFAPLRVAATIPSARARIDRLMVEDHQFAQGRPDAPKRVFLDPPVSSRFAEITSPTLVVVGDGEMSALAEQGALMARGIPGAQLSVIKGAGHIVNIEQPEAYTEIVLDWLRSH
ncbi:MAG: alpha/beta fold hydrolase [Chloroflexota bacterium]